eukprot:1275478-Pyramimonas_sp.AAC.1
MCRYLAFRDVTIRDHHRRSGPFTTVLRQVCRFGTREGQTHVVDAKPMYDTMIKKGNARAKYRRAASDLAIICEALEQASCQVRGTLHGRMP